MYANISIQKYASKNNVESIFVDEMMKIKLFKFNSLKKKDKLDDMNNLAQRGPHSFTIVEALRIINKHKQYRQIKIT